MKRGASRLWKPTSKSLTPSVISTHDGEVAPEGIHPTPQFVLDRLSVEYGRQGCAVLVTPVGVSVVEYRAKEAVA